MCERILIQVYQIVMPSLFTCIALRWCAVLLFREGYHDFIDDMFADSQFASSHVQGYYTRVSGIRLLIQQFMECGGRQFVILGAGFDTHYFSLKVVALFFLLSFSSGLSFYVLIFFFFDCFSPSLESRSRVC
jgi:hypothetical protein